MSDMPARLASSEAAAAEDHRTAETETIVTAGTDGDTAARAPSSSLTVADTGDSRREDTVAVNPFWSQKARDEAQQRGLPFWIPILDQHPVDRLRCEWLMTHH